MNNTISYKEKFLEELKEYIQILEEQEQEDILEEYAQHIDMKLQKGLSEEEAIQDFGPMKVLAAEILEAYHVKPEFGQKKKSRLFPAQGGERAGTDGSGMKQIAGWLKKKGAAIGRGIKSGFRWIGGTCSVFVNWLGKPFRKRKTESIYALEGEIMEDMYAYESDIDGQYGDSQSVDSVSVESVPKTAEGDMPAADSAARQRGTERTAAQRPQKGKTVGRRFNDFFRMLGRGCAKLWQMFLFCIVFCLRLFWNAAWLLFSILCGGFAMIALAGFGTLLILFFQNYPLGGILLITLGGVMCFGALSCFAFSLMIRKKGKAQQGGNQRDDADKAEGEVQYE